jgi:hypothetical protein
MQSLWEICQDGSGEHMMSAVVLLLMFANFPDVYSL